MNITIKKMLILTLFCILVINSCSVKINEKNSAEAFSQFRKYFQKIDLPIKWNRHDIGRFGMPPYGQKSKYNEIPINFPPFIPDDIKHSDSATYIRALYQLPSKEDFHLFIVATDYMFDRYGDGDLYSILTRLYLIAYNDLGKVLFHSMIAGNFVDEWDKLVHIDEDYIIKTRHYEFLNGTIRHPSKNLHIGLMKYNKTLCEITVNGITNCNSIMITGFFESHLDDYELILRCNEN